MTDAPKEILSSIDHVLNDVFGFATFRARQREVCLSAWRGKDVLLVMPTGAGKSLCYQLPTIARQDGRALVISPLIALIEDQVQKLQQLGISAERIHSGRSRSESQDACRDWREGRLQFLFIAPERLGVPGFIEFLEENKPALIAVDEAHCISMWGHDFRADYRQLGPRLERLRPANIVALTATATPEVQKDIVAQLALKNPDIFIHGFRRDNIAIEVLELTPGARLEAAVSILKDKARLPCIVYAPTRKLAESTALELQKYYRTGVFHAGLPAQDRQMVQDAFLQDRLDVMVATIAFGMGVDKANVRTIFHLALPGSLEAYYQEIGRAGRDGKLSSAVLMFAPVDRKTHEYFMDLNYPEPETLETMVGAIKAGSTNRDEVAARLGMAPDIVRSGLEKLWIHGGIVVKEDGTLVPGKAGWERRYLMQRRNRQEQLAGALAFANHKSCRMLRLITHFGDHTDARKACGICDRCRGPSVLLEPVKRITAEDSLGQDEMLKLLIPFQSKTSGQVYKELFEPRGWDRRRFDGILWDLESQGLMFQVKQTFVKNGESIDFLRVGLTDEGRRDLHKRKLAPSLAVQRVGIDERLVSSRRKASNRKRAPSKPTRRI
jgi:DNA topoisomerase III